MKPGWGPFDPGHASADHPAQFLRTVEGLHSQQRPPHLERGVCVRADGAGDIVQFGKPARLTVEAWQHAARVEDLDRIHERQDLEQVRLHPAARAESVKGMGYAYEGILLAQPVDRLAGGQSGWDLLRHVGSKDFAARCHDLLPDDDQPGIQFLRRARPIDRVVIGDDQAIDTSFSRRGNQVGRAR